MKTALSASEVDAKLRKLHVEWSVLGGTTLERIIKCDDFAEALQIVNAVGKLAEHQNHHPDITFGWGKVQIHITTHSLSALTSADFKLAAAIERVLEA